MSPLWKPRNRVACCAEEPDRNAGREEPVCFTVLLDLRRSFAATRMERPVSVSVNQDFESFDDLLSYLHSYFGINGAQLMTADGEQITTLEAITQDDILTIAGGELALPFESNESRIENMGKPPSQSGVQCSLLSAERLLLPLDGRCYVEVRLPNDDLGQPSFTTGLADVCHRWQEDASRDFFADKTDLCSGPLRLTLFVTGSDGVSDLLGEASLQPSFWTSGAALVEAKAELPVKLNGADVGLLLLMFRSVAFDSPLSSPLSAPALSCDLHAGPTLCGTPQRPCNAETQNGDVCEVSNGIELSTCSAEASSNSDTAETKATSVAEREVPPQQNLSVDQHHEDGEGHGSEPSYLRTPRETKEHLRMRAMELDIIDHPYYGSLQRLRERQWLKEHGSSFGVSLLSDGADAAALDATVNTLVTAPPTPTISEQLSSEQHQPMAATPSFPLLALSDVACHDPFRELRERSPLTRELAHLNGQRTSGLSEEQTPGEAAAVAIAAAADVMDSLTNDYHRGYAELPTAVGEL